MSNPNQPPQPHGPDQDLVYIQVIDGPGPRVTVSLHPVTAGVGTAPAFGWVSLTEEAWKKFKADGDRALATATGREPPLDPRDPSFYHAIPLT